MYYCSNFSILAYAEIILPICLLVELIEYICKNYIMSHLHCVKCLVLFINTRLITCSMKFTPEYFTSKEIYL